MPPKKLDFTSTEEDKTEPYIYVYRNPLEKEIQEIKEFLSLKRELKVKEQGTLSEMTKDIPKLDENAIGNVCGKCHRYANHTRKPCKNQECGQEKRGFHEKEKELLMSRGV